MSDDDIIVIGGIIGIVGGIYLLTHHRTQNTLSVIDYRYITDGMNGRTLDEVVNILKETKTDVIFEGWVTEYQPLIEDCTVLPFDCQGYDYKRMREAIAYIKSAIPSIKIGGGMLWEFLFQYTVNPYTGAILDKETAWSYALDPSKWGVNMGKYEFQCLMANHFLWANSVCNCTLTSCTDYDPKTSNRAYIPDITNPLFQQLFLDLIKIQIDYGVDYIWIDGLFGQSYVFELLTQGYPDRGVDAMNTARIESHNASSYIIDQIHEYARLKGKNIKIISWLLGVDYNIKVPDIDVIMTTPSYDEVITTTLDPVKWDTYISDIRKYYPNTPIFARLDYAESSNTPIFGFSQILTTEQANAFLVHASEFFRKRNISFSFPVHGEYLSSTNPTKLSYGKYGFYDSLAPEFNTYPTIRSIMSTLK